MLHLALLTSFTIILAFWMRKLLLEVLLANKGNEYNQAKCDYETLVKQSTELKIENLRLQNSLDAIIALYDITKDICKTLEEDEIFSIFRERIDRYIKVGDCKYIKSGQDLSDYKDYTAVPLSINKHNIGHLVVSEIESKNKDKFNILTGQFILGMKRALLYKQVQELSIVDSLTEVFNRRFFLQRLNEEFERSGKFNHNFSFIMIDIDNFKNYNDSYGHLVGDVILKEVARTIKENIRQIDFLGRYGGEEFSLILTETDKEQAEFAAERIRRSVQDKTIRAYDEELKVTISLGVAVYPGDSKGREELINKADKMMYNAKHLGRNKVCIYGE